MLVMMVVGERGEGVTLNLGQMAFLDPPHVGEASAYTTEPMQRQLATAVVGPIDTRLGFGTPDQSSDGTEGSRSRITPLSMPADWVVLPQVKRMKLRFRRASKTESTDSQGPHKEVSEDFNISNTHLGEGANLIECVMNVKNRPLCNHPHLNAKAEMDTATHLSICVNSDCNKVDWIFVGNCGSDPGTEEMVYEDYYQGFEWGF